jgi:hypothetical protein
VCPKVRHLQYKIRRLQYKIRYLQVFAGAAFYLYLPENILQTPALSCQITAFFVSSVHLAIEAGFGCSLLVASNVFVDHKPDFYVQKQKQCTLMNAGILSAR